MNLQPKKEPNQTELRVHHQESFVSKTISDFIIQKLPSEACEVVIVCIGTDRSTGDALGPFTGSLLSKWRLPRFTIYGTLDQPVHALNLKETVTMIKEKHKGAFILAIDACLGKQSSVGTIAVETGPIQPGLALKKNLPPVGDIHMKGIVNVSSSVDYLTLQNTRLFLVVQLAEIISRSLFHLHTKLDTFSREKPLKKLDSYG